MAAGFDKSAFTPLTPFGFANERLSDRDHQRYSGRRR